jgi:hypothetical protein
MYIAWKPLIVCSKISAYNPLVSPKAAGVAVDATGSGHCSFAKYQHRQISPAAFGKQ